MVDVKIQRKLAAKVLKVGVHRVKINPEKMEDVSFAVTRRDIQGLIKSKVIKKRNVKGTSRARARVLHLKKKRGQRKGLGSRKGKKTARMPRKRTWINKIRALRKHLRKLKEEGYIDVKTYRLLYRRAKGNVFRSVSYLNLYINEHGLAKKRLPEGYR